MYLVLYKNPSLLIAIRLNLFHLKNAKEDMLEVTRHNLHILKAKDKFHALQKNNSREIQIILLRKSHKLRNLINDTGELTPVRHKIKVRPKTTVSSQL